MRHLCHVYDSEFEQSLLVDLFGIDRVQWPRNARQGFAHESREDGISSSRDCLRHRCLSVMSLVLTVVAVQDSNDKPSSLVRF